MSQEVHIYDAVADPVASSDPSGAKPIGVGSVATGGDVLDVSVNVGPFSGLVDISLTEYMQATGSVYSMTTTASGDYINPSSGNNEVWKAGVTGLNQHAFGPIPVSQLKKGVYFLTLTATTSGSGASLSYSYQWTTYFVVGGANTASTGIVPPAPVPPAPVTPTPVTPTPVTPAPAPATPIWVAPPVDTSSSGV